MSKQPKTFYAWLKARIDDDTSIGDLARDVRQDSHFSKSAKTLRTYERHFAEIHASDEAERALQEAWKSYQGEEKGESK